MADTTKKKVEELASLDAALTDPADVADRKRYDLADAEARRRLGPNEFIGPPQEQPWDKWSPKERLSADRTVEVLDGVRDYHNAGKAGLGTKYGPAHDLVMSSGGVDPDVSEIMARYKMAKQGEMTPVGPRIKDDSPEETNRRNKDFFAAPKEERGKILDREKAIGAQRAAEAHYDDISRKRPVKTYQENVSSRGSDK